MIGVLLLAKCPSGFPQQLGTARGGLEGGRVQRGEETVVHRDRDSARQVLSRT